MDRNCLIMDSDGLMKARAAARTIDSKTFDQVLDENVDGMEDTHLSLSAFLFCHAER